jgi:hypothetical protein
MTGSGPAATGLRATSADAARKSRPPMAVTPLSDCTRRDISLPSFKRGRFQNSQSAASSARLLTSSGEPAINGDSKTTMDKIARLILMRRDQTATFLSDGHCGGSKPGVGTGSWWVFFFIRDGFTALP